jgi:hypothetical protein
MDTFRIKLTTNEFSELNPRFPSSRGSGDIGKRALEIIKYHFKNQNPGCRFVETPSGADFAVLPVGAAVPMVFEVKGTADADIAWPQLKVSSKSSHALLTSGSASVLRVTDVFGREPVVMNCGTDRTSGSNRRRAGRSSGPAEHNPRFCEGR